MDKRLNNKRCKGERKYSLKWSDLIETYGSPDVYLKEIKIEMEADLEKAWKHIIRQKDKATNREYWFMTEWKASLKKHLLI